MDTFVEFHCQSCKFRSESLTEVMQHLILTSELSDSKGGLNATFHDVKPVLMQMDED